MKTKENLNRHELLSLVSDYEKLVESLREEPETQKPTPPAGTPGDGELDISLYSVGGGQIDGAFNVNGASGYLLGYAAYLLGASFRDVVAGSPEAWKNPGKAGLLEVIKMNFAGGINPKKEANNLTEKTEKEK